MRSEIEQVLVDVSTTYDIPLNDLKSRFDSLKDESQDSSPRKRGRRKKQKEEFIEMEEIIYEGTTYLVDANNNVYTFNLEAPHMIGERFVDGTVRFFLSR